MEGVSVDPWWIVQIGYITEDDVKVRRTTAKMRDVRFASSSCLRRRILSTDSGFLKGTSECSTTVQNDIASTDFTGLRPRHRPNVAEWLCSLNLRLWLVICHRCSGCFSASRKLHFHGSSSVRETHLSPRENTTKFRSRRQLLPDVTASTGSGNTAMTRKPIARKAVRCRLSSQ